jgi:hypothetical protein
MWQERFKRRCFYGTNRRAPENSIRITLYADTTNYAIKSYLEAHDGITFDAIAPCNSWVPRKSSYQGSAVIGGIQYVFLANIGIVICQDIA